MIKELIGKLLPELDPFLIKWINIPYKTLERNFALIYCQKRSHSFGSKRVCHENRVRPVSRETPVWILIFLSGLQVCAVKSYNKKAKTARQYEMLKNEVESTVSFSLISCCLVRLRNEKEIMSRETKHPHIDQHERQETNLNRMDWIQWTYNISTSRVRTSLIDHVVFRIQDLHAKWI